MNILEEVTKEVFERHVPAAKMPERNSSVYVRMQGMITTAYDTLVNYVITPELLDQALQNRSIKEACIRYVCLAAFVRMVRSLDLVLTATGFGIVSTESTAPASRARVEALLEEMQVEVLRTSEQIVKGMTTISGWGDTEAARSMIATLFYRPSLLENLTTLPLTFKNWSTAQGLSLTADAHLRQTVSEEYMNELLHKSRTASLENADIIIVDKCNAFTADLISNYEATHGSHNHLMLRSIMEQLEAYVDDYPTYKASRLYARKHYTRYQNHKDDPTFFFM